MTALPLNSPSPAAEPPIAASTAPQLDCSVVGAVERLAGRTFARVALVSHSRHLAGLDPADTNLLVVSTDWLAWQSWRQRGGQAVHYEGFLGEWPNEAGPPEHIFVRHSDWMYDGDLDLTLFQGVSIGKIFTTHAGFTVRAYYRLAGALTRLVAEVRPSCVLFFDAYVEFGVLSPHARRAIVLDMAARHGLELRDKFDPVLRSETGLPEEAYSGSDSDVLRRVPLSRWAYSMAVDALSRAVGLVRSQRTGVFFHLNWNSLQRIVDRFGKDSVVALAPVLVASQQPKTPSFLMRCIREGIRLSHLPQAPLTAAEERAIEQMQKAVRQKLAAEKGGVSGALLAFVQDVIERKEFHGNARLIKGYRRLFHRNKVRRVVIGDVGNGVGRLLAELAKAEGIPCDEILNGVFVCPISWDARNGDRRRGPIVDRLLTWGHQNEQWRVLSGLTIPYERTGYPAIESFGRLPRHASDRRRALVLPLSTECSDVRALRANVFSYLVEIVDVLLRRGFEVRVKLHPGRPQPDYYNRVLAQFSLTAQVVKDGPLSAQLEWADIVIGPINSNAFLEALAAGRQYYAIVPHPSSIEPKLCGSALVCRSADQLAAVLDANVATQGDEVLAFFCDLDAQNPPSRQLWHALTRGQRRSLDTVTSK